ncbi:hypothetical protein XA68_16086 [Ophiocordyceps unilateralis]|uniref:Uncharacterized protein n=1 Tax=Ophiocordyceps unilateralis TaxID=268505 RepID=A0A2A9PK26_OPHUN|nr:hypothetical protein XA68_16086 [Ophiocordyceps unilateralis]
MATAISDQAASPSSSSSSPSPSSSATNTSTASPSVASSSATSRAAVTTTPPPPPPSLCPGSSSPSTDDQLSAAMSPAATPEPIIWPLKPGPDPGAKAHQYPRYEPPSAVLSPPDSEAGQQDHHRPLRTASVRSDTRLAHPKPIAKPIANPVHSKLRPGSPRGSVAQLEATAERLSMTSSIDDAIRNLLSELKASDSRRSSMLLRMTSIDADDADDQPRRHLSTSSSIVSTNIAARHGGYSPAAFVMSPAHSLSNRRRSDLDLGSMLSRHGPGKSSVHSAGLSLAEISESEPISLTQDALDEADAAPPIDEDDEDDQDTPMLSSHDQQQQETLPPVAHSLQGYHDAADVPPPLSVRPQPAADEAGGRDGTRPPSSRSTSTFQQCRDAFRDFDGVHWDPDQAHLLVLPGADSRAALPAGYVRPQSYVDVDSGQDMTFYPARVPAMLNVPPKLSNKVKAAQRNQRVSQVLSAMFEPDGVEAPVHSAVRASTDSAPHTWLADPIATSPRSLAMDIDVCPDKESPRVEARPVSGALRRPQRLSGMDPEKHKSPVTKLPPQLRASAFFDLPSTTADVEIKDGSAMATLDDLLDASATAPVGAFTDHTLAGKLGSEVYGKKKKHKTHKSVATLDTLSPEPKPKKRSSLLWLGKRSSHDGENKSLLMNMTSADDDENSVQNGAVEAAGDGSGEDRAEEEEEDEEEDDEDNVYRGPPTTLLAELQLRKQEQQQRKKNFGSGFPNGIHATLLEMDTVAETQRKHRQTKRVNLAWEEPGAHVDQNGSDDEDVPLAILAAMHQGAKNRADLERPMGLMERRELEDNEPLSRRRARLQGLDTLPAGLRRHQSAMSLGALAAVDSQSPCSWAGGVSPVPQQQPQQPQEKEGEEEAEEDMGETLGERRRRLAASASGSDADHLPRARPVSSSFSAELLGQFGDGDAAPAEPSDGGKAVWVDTTAEGEETLGQRRRRLQAEREARNREMSHGSPMARATPRLVRQLSMADVLAAHPMKDSVDGRAMDEFRRAEESRIAASEREAKLAAARRQMPRSLTTPSGMDRSGGFRGGVYNDGTGGCGPQASRSSLALGSQGRGAYGLGGVFHNGYGSAVVAQPMYGATMDMYGGGMMMMPRSAGLMGAAGGGSMDRVEQWRRGVRP